MQPTEDRLRAIPLFSDLNDDDLARLATWFTVEEASEGTRLTPEGASGYRFFVIAEGTAEVRQHQDRSRRSERASSSARWRSWATVAGSPTSWPRPR